jgi:hypothetical protein
MKLNKSEAVSTSLGQNGKRAEGSHDEGRCLKLNQGTKNFGAS